MTEVTSFDGTTSAQCEIVRLSHADIRAGTAKCRAGMIPRGSGLSPRLLSAEPGGKSLALSGKPDAKDFMVDRGTLTVSVPANATFTEVNVAVFAFGLELPVMPGLPGIQIGAGIAACVHGKNQYLYDFGDQIVSLTLLLFSNEIVECSKTENGALFDLTIGGYGSTGLILNAVLKLQQVRSTTIERTRTSVRRLVDFLPHFSDPALTTYHGAFGWHNLHASKTTFGRGFYYSDTLVDRTALYQPPVIRAAQEKFLEKPAKFYAAGGLLFGSLFNRLYELKEARRPPTSQFNSFAGTLGAKNTYWSIMRANGFLEVQFIVPYDRFGEFAEYVQSTLQRMKPTISVCITKPSAGVRKYLRFRGAGVNFDMNGMKTARNQRFFAEVNRTAHTFGAIPNIVKCSILGAPTIRECYGEQYDLFLEHYRKEIGTAPPPWFLQNGLLPT